MRSRSRSLFAVVASVLLFTFVLSTFAPGCAKTTQAGVDQAEILYGATLGELNDLREAGVIDAGTYTNVVTPARKTARQSIDKAKAAVQAGDTTGAKSWLDAANAALLELQKYRAKHSSINRTEPSMAMVDPVSSILLIIGLIQRLTPIVGKLVKGEELTDEERATAEAVSASETARADRLDAEARGGGPAA